MNFKVSLSKSQLKVGETAKVRFRFENNSGNTEHILFYHFIGFKDGEVTIDFKPHEFYKILNPNEIYEKEYNEVDPLKYYLGGGDAGDYNIVVRIKYLTYGQEEPQIIQDNVGLTIE